MKRRQLPRPDQIECNEGDFCPCGGTYVRTPQRRFRLCGLCGTPEPGVEVFAKLPNGQTVSAPPHELDIMTRRRR